MSEMNWEHRDTIILAALRRAADRGDPCPSRTRLAQMIGLGYHSAATKALNRLQRDGLIRYESYAGGPVVTIVETGKSTRKPRDTRRHWKAARPAQMTMGQPLTPVLTPSFNQVAAHDATLAGQIRSEAFRKGMAIADLMAELVQLGWPNYLATRPAPDNC